MTPDTILGGHVFNNYCFHLQLTIQPLNISKKKWKKKRRKTTLFAEMSSWFTVIAFSGSMETQEGHSNQPIKFPPNNTYLSLAFLSSNFLDFFSMGNIWNNKQKTSLMWHFFATYSTVFDSLLLQKTACKLFNWGICTSFSSSSSSSSSPLSSSSFSQGNSSFGWEKRGETTHFSSGTQQQNL